MDCCRCGMKITPYCADCAVMTVAEVMVKLHRSRQTVDKLIHQGKLNPILKVHRRVLIKRAEVEALLRG
jgi:excisionase family DNA binding protein